MRVSLGTSVARLSEAIAGVSMIALVALVAVQIAADQIASLPPSPPTALQSAEARPGAEARWRAVYPSLAARLPSYDGTPLEIGKVWATRTGRLCGLVNDREAGMDRMVPFYTNGKYLKFRDDDVFSYFHLWRSCAQDEWVILHEGTTYTGMCASAWGRNTRFGRARCSNWIVRSLAIAP